jgi:hypothetical protein
MAADWRTEFGDDYDVPHEVTARLWDQSWHHDACPSFTHTDFPPDGSGHDLRLWVEHPDPERRETGAPRYAVVHGEALVLGTDDLMAALAAIDRQAAELRDAAAERAWHAAHGEGGF